MVGGLTLQMMLLALQITSKSLPILRNAKVCGIKSNLSVNNDVFQTGYKPKAFFAAWAGH